MENTGYIALSAEAALQRRMDTIANNIANMNTSAYKSEQMMFVQHLVKSRGDDRIAPTKLAFVRDVGMIRDLSEGPIRVTGNPLDVALKGEGYLAVQTPQGERYTRDGRLQLNANGALVTQEGYQVMSTAGTPFFFTPEDKDIHIARDGTISTRTGDLGKIRVVKFNDPRNLLKVGGNLYKTDQAPQDVQNPDVVQNALEGSNVQPVIEMARMIDTHRSYDNVRMFIDREDQRIRNMMNEYTRVV